MINLFIGIKGLHRSLSMYALRLTEKNKYCVSTKAFHGFSFVGPLQKAWGTAYKFVHQVMLDNKVAPFIQYLLWDLKCNDFPVAKGEPTFLWVPVPISQLQ